MYCRECGATLPEDANFCPKCGSRVISEKRPVETHRTMKVSGKPKLIITNIAPGSIEVKSGSKGQVTVDLDLRNPENLDFDSSQEGDTITITCRSLLSSWIWPSYIFGVGPRANIYLTVPAKADLELETSAGRISVTGVKGNMVAESSAGAIRYSDCEGTIRSRTNAGSIRLRNVNAIVSARVLQVP